VRRPGRPQRRGGPDPAGAQRLVAALAEPGCPVCRCLEAETRRNLAAFLREQTMDPEGRAALRRAGGFCGWHTGLLREAAAGILSVALVAEDLLQGEPPRRVACPACAVLRDRVGIYLEALLEGPASPALRAALAAGPGVPCRPHLRGARALAPADPRVAALEDAIAPRLARLGRALAGFIAKQDYRSPAPPNAEEARAWSEALEHLAGRPGLLGSEVPRS